MDEFVNDFDTEGDQRGYYVPVKADKRPKGDKYDRIEASQSFFERRNVWFNIDERESADQIERPGCRRRGVFETQHRFLPGKDDLPVRETGKQKILNFNSYRYEND